MKSLRTIRKLSKLGRILSTIVFIFSVIGFAACTVGAVVTACIGANLNGFFADIAKKVSEKEVSVTFEAVLSTLICSAVICAGEAVLSKFAEHYFKRELADGTPFDLGGAAELKRLGLLTILIPIGASTLAFMAHAIMKLVYKDLPDFDYSNGTTIMLGVMMLVGSVLCKYGAEKDAAAAPQQSEDGGAN